MSHEETAREWLDWQSVKSLDDGDCLYSLARLLASVEAKALERAAKECQSEAAEWRSVNASDAARNCAARIRALIPGGGEKTWSNAKPLREVVQESIDVALQSERPAPTPPPSSSGEGPPERVTLKFSDGRLMLPQYGGPVDSEHVYISADVLEALVQEWRDSWQFSDLTRAGDQLDRLLRGGKEE